MPELNDDALACFDVPRESVFNVSYSSEHPLPHVGVPCTPVAEALPELNDDVLALVHKACEGVLYICHSPEYALAHVGVPCTPVAEALPELDDDVFAFLHESGQGSFDFVGYAGRLGRDVLRDAALVAQPEAEVSKDAQPCVHKARQLSFDDVRDGLCPVGDVVGQLPGVCQSLPYAVDDVEARLDKVGKREDRPDCGCVAGQQVGDECPARRDACLDAVCDHAAAHGRRLRYSPGNRERCVEGLHERCPDVRLDPWGDDACCECVLDSCEHTFRDVSAVGLHFLARARYVKRFLDALDQRRHHVVFYQLLRLLEVVADSGHHSGSHVRSGFGDFAVCRLKRCADAAHHARLDGLRDLLDFALVAACVCI